MDIAPQHALRTLRYIDMVNSHGGRLDTNDIDAYAQAHPPKDLAYGTAFTQMEMYLNSYRLSSPQPVSLYLQTVGWITTYTEGVMLTPLGKAVLRAEMAKDEEPETPTPGAVQDVVLNPENPVAIVHLIRRLQDAGAGMIVDPYFKADMLPAICESTTITRILIANRKEKEPIGYALHELKKAHDRIPEVRNSKERKMHDRCIITAEGKVSLIGGSMTGVGTNLTSIVHPEEAVQKFYRQEYEKIWTNADPIEPKQFREPVTPTNEGDTPPNQE